MKKILVTGAGGTVGLQVIRFLLSEGKYEITALDLKNKYVYKRLKTFKKRINIVYGDATDESIIDALVKSHDVVIHLAGVLPPLANIKEDFCKKIDYVSTTVITDAIKNYNPDCYLLYASSTSVYGINNLDNKVTVETECQIDNYDYYSKYKLMSEDYIKDNLKNYSIFRLAYVLGDPGSDSLIYGVKLNSKLETVSAEDVGYVFSSAVENKKYLNKKTFNVSGGKKFRIKYSELVNELLTSYGLSFKFLGSLLGIDKIYSVGYYDDGDKLEEILHFRSKNVNVYYNSLHKYKNKVFRIIPRILAMPLLLFIKKDGK